VGAWSWNSHHLHSKIIKGPKDLCWTWQGSKGPQGNLFGARKNLRPQMIQVNRLLLMEQLNHPIDNIAVKMRCGNRYCCNPNHFNYNQPNQRRPDYQPIELFRLTISEHRFQHLSAEQHADIKAMAKEYAHNSGIDWEWENRWMIIAASDLLLAQIKYPDIMPLFTAQTIKT